MKLLDLLRKLGILRYGATAGVYHNAQERPMAFAMDDVYDEQKDLSGGKKKSCDLPQIKRTRNGGGEAYISPDFD
ncbi:MAG: hypothetical protein AB9873_09330 [Syntrophobacteraceae bacterium]